MIYYRLVINFSYWLLSHLIFFAFEINMGKHTIILLQYDANRNTRTYYDYQTSLQACQGIFFENLL